MEIKINPFSERDINISKMKVVVLPYIQPKSNKEYTADDLHNRSVNHMVKTPPANWWRF